MLMFAGILGRGFAWTSFVWDGLLADLYYRTRGKFEYVWMSFSMRFVFVGLDSVWVYKGIPMGWTLSNHMNIYINGPYYLNSFGLVGLGLTYDMNWYDPAYLFFFIVVLFRNACDRLVSQVFLNRIIAEAFQAAKGLTYRFPCLDLPLALHPNLGKWSVPCTTRLCLG